MRVNAKNSTVGRCSKRYQRPRFFRLCFFFETIQRKLPNMGRIGVSQANSTSTGGSCARYDTVRFLLDLLSSP